MMAREYRWAVFWSAVLAVAAIWITVASVKFTSCTDDPVCRANRHNREAEKVEAFQATYDRRRAELAKS